MGSYIHTVNNTRLYKIWLNVCLDIEWFGRRLPTLCCQVNILHGPDAHKGLCTVVLSRAFIVKGTNRCRGSGLRCLRKE